MPLLDKNAQSPDDIGFSYCLRAARQRSHGRHCTKLNAHPATAVIMLDHASNIGADLLQINLVVAVLKSRAKNRFVVDSHQYVVYIISNERLSFTLSAGHFES
jgi:hypothetical protein